MGVEAKQTYGIKGSRSQRDFVRVTAVEDGMVRFHPLAGGFEQRCTVDVFEKDFEHIDENTMKDILNTFERVSVWTDSMEEPLPAWSNGTLWNGWQVPYLEREAIEQGIENGSLNSKYGIRTVFLSDGTVLQALLQCVNDNAELPLDFDWSDVERRLRAGDEVYEAVLADGVFVDAELVAAQEIMTPEGPRTVYPIGNGWCWELAPEPEAEAAPEAVPAP